MLYNMRSLLLYEVKLCLIRLESVKMEETKEKVMAEWVGTGTKTGDFRETEIEAIMMAHSPQNLQDSRHKVVAGIPCHNTESFIGDVVSSANKYVDQVIVVDDGSTDGSAEVARGAGAIVISHSTNQGYGEALKSCFEMAKTNGANILVTIDSDGQHDPEEIPLLLAPILRGEADVVIGSRFLTNEVNMPSYRKFGISLISFLFNLGSRTKVSDSQSGFRAYNKEIIESFLLSEPGMSISIESLEKARRNGVIIKEVPISCVYPPSILNMKAISHGLSVAFSVLRIRLKSGLLAWRRGNERP